MKKVLITYHMTNGEEDAETCIALPMADEVAEDVLTWPLHTARRRSPASA